MRSEGPSQDRSDLPAAKEAGKHCSQTAPNHEAAELERDEQNKIRRLQLMMDLVMSVIAQDKNLTVDQAAEIVASSKKAALDLFPDKELAYNMIYKPRLQRLMRERFRIQ